MSEEPGFTPDSPLTRKPKPNRLFLQLLGYFAAVAVGTAIVSRLFGQEAAGLFAFFWLCPVLLACQGAAIYLRRHDPPPAFGKFLARWFY
jgi:hypothetical protein